MLISALSEFNEDTRTNNYSKESLLRPSKLGAPMIFLPENAPDDHVELKQSKTTKAVKNRYGRHPFVKSGMLTTSHDSQQKAALNIKKSILPHPGSERPITSTNRTRNSLVASSGS